MTTLKHILYAALLTLPTLSVVASANAPISGFADSSLANWEEKSFVGNTTYELFKESGITVLKANTNRTASLLFKKEVIDLKRTPWIDWSWKVGGIYDIQDEKVKKGDDFPARLYVSAKTGPMPWNTVVINYVWSSKELAGTSWVNPFTKRSIMIAVQSGGALSNEWVAQRRNIVNDFKTYFNEDVTRLPGYAIMVDGDNSGQKGTAYFGGISFSAD